MMSLLTSSVIALIENAGALTWLEVAFLIEGKSHLLNIEKFNEAGREAFSHNNNSIQTVLNTKTTSDVSNDPQIVNFVCGLLTRKKKVNCLGTALVAYLVAVANDVPCTFCCSETHSWIEINDGVRIDVASNVKAAQKSVLPLSIYYNRKPLDYFALCLLIVVNDNSLEDEEELAILVHFQSKLQHSWEFSKRFSLGLELKHTDTSLSLLERDPFSIELRIQRILYFINDVESAEHALDSMECFLKLVDELCGRYNMNSDMWLLPKCSLLFIAEEFTSQFKCMTDLVARYEAWCTMAIDIARCHVAGSVQKFARSLPIISGKRRRIAK